MLLCFALVNESYHYADPPKMAEFISFICVCHYLITPGVPHLLKLIVFSYTNKMNFSVVATADTEQTGTNCTVHLTISGPSRYN